MQVNKINNTNFGMALKIDKGLKKELQNQPTEFLDMLGELGNKISDVKLYSVVLEENKGLSNPAVRSATKANSPDYFLSLKSEEQNLGKWYEVPAGSLGDTSGGFYPDEPYAFRKLYGKEAAQKYKEFKALNVYDQAAEYSRILENIEVKRLIEDAKTKSSKQFAEYVQKMKQQEHESAVDELLSRYQNDVVVTETQNNDKKGFFSRLKDSLKLFG